MFTMFISLVQRVNASRKCYNLQINTEQLRLMGMSFILQLFGQTIVIPIPLMVTLEKKSVAHHSQQDSAGHSECFVQNFMPIRPVVETFSLEQSGGPTNRPTVRPTDPRTKNLHWDFLISLKIHCSISKTDSCSFEIGVIPVKSSYQSLSK